MRGIDAPSRFGLLEGQQQQQLVGGTPDGIILPDEISEYDSGSEHGSKGSGGWRRRRISC
jgi:hypothetical protein